MKITVLLFSFLWTITAAAAVEYDSGYTIFCKDGVCPAAVAAFISNADITVPVSGPQTMLCSSTLIANNRILTNIHCLPESLKKAGSDCSTTSEILFPESGSYPAERVACDKIIELGTSDWAVVQMKKATLRPAEKLSESALALGSKIYGYPIYYNAFFPLGELRPVSCTISELGYLDMHTFHPESRDFFATQCSEPIQVGNSGTAFFNSSNEFVALLNSASHHRFATAAEVQASGSPSIRGIKTKCIGYNKSVEDICSWNSEDKDFQTLAVEYSTLLSFKKHQPVMIEPVSQYINWQRSTTDSLPLFEKLYPYSELASAKNLVALDPYKGIAQELDTLALEILPWSPTCVQSDRTELEDRFSYILLNYQDFTVYPSETGSMYLSVDDNLELHVRPQIVDLPVSVKFISEKNMYEVSYLKKQDPFALNAKEENTLKVCLAEEALKKENCAKSNCTMTSKELSTPSLPCQTLFKKKTSSLYLQPFALELPRCKPKIN